MTFELTSPKNWSKLLSCLALSSFSSIGYSQLPRIKKPKLIFVLVIDQFRADQLPRFQKRFLPPLSPKGGVGGFRYLTEQGAYFPYAEYGLLQNMTCPGHATILSGAYAYQNGIPLNDWFDNATGKGIYCVEDSSSPVVSASPQHAESLGISPRNLIGSTLGDELKNSGYRSKVVTIALKDRSAVLLGGHRSDLALWFDADNSQWMSSRYYLPDGKLPEWVQNLNKSLSKGKHVEWTLPAEASSGTSLESNRLIIPSKTMDIVKREFPHQAATGSKDILLFPYGTQITVNAAQAALEALNLGQGSDVDLLAVSLSNHDFIGHLFGPNSRELEEITVAEDKEISRLLNILDHRIGLENIVIAVTGDHGVSPQTEWLSQEKMPSGRINETKYRSEAEDFLVKTYGSAKKGSWIHGAEDFNIYLNHASIQAAKLDVETVQIALAGYFKARIKDMEGILDVFSGVDVRKRTLPPMLIEKLILKTYKAGRSGDVILIPKPYYVGLGSTATHVSGFSYDRMVPMMLVGPQIKPGVYAQKVEVIDIAPTLAFFAGTTPPSGSEGRVLHEILQVEVKK